MAVAIRLQRIGKPKQPYYRIVAAESRKPAQGKFLEILGTYNPRAEKKKDKITLKRDRYDYWVGVGARPSDTVRSLVKGSNKEEAAVAVAEPKAKPAAKEKPAEAKADEKPAPAGPKPEA